MNNSIFNGIGKAIVTICLNTIAITPTFAALVVAGVNDWIAVGVSFIAVVTTRTIVHIQDKIDECD